VYPAESRQAIVDEVYDLVGPMIFSDEDLHEKTLELVGDRNDTLDEEAFTETEQYRAARGVVKKKYGEDELNGFYFQSSIKDISDRFCDYLMKSTHVDDVFDSDNELAKKIVVIVKRFDTRNVQ